MKIIVTLFLTLTFFCIADAQQQHRWRTPPTRPTRKPEDQSRRLKTIVEWNQLDFEFPESGERDRAIGDKRFIQKNCLPMDVDVKYAGNNQNRMFVTIPRIQGGIPVTLGTILVNTTGDTVKNPLIKPYPDYSWHKTIGQCDGITSVFRVMTDDCNKLWVLDTGKVGRSAWCRPQLLIFDLSTDKLVRRYRIPDDQFVRQSLFETLVLDINTDCQNAKAYLADSQGFSLIVYDFTENRSFKIQHELFKNTRGHERITVAGESFQFQFNVGILGMALAKRSRRAERNDDNRHLYFHSLNGITENSVPLKILKDGDVLTGNPSANGGQFKEIGNRGVQSAAQAMDMRGNLFFGLADPLAIACWDASTPYNRNNVKLVTRNNETLQFASGVKVIKNFLGQEDLWVMTNRLQKYYSRTTNEDYLNFRVLMRPINELLTHKRCNSETFSVNLNSF